ncbi:chaperonin 10-like protein [Mycena pura]|uniref:Chaperonin 10-like protein n=1 Tax=Mycena pura TaxID=153505 RepID=A0AAD6YI84_9AGAR|nr:chaperonin 10-like protein [Mycena pura]
MSLPTTAREYSYPQLGSFENLVVRDVPLNPPKATQVLVKVHAVSLQVRDLMISSGQYPGSTPPNLVPCSDMAGEVVAVGESVTEWAPGDRVCANFMLDKLHDEQTDQINDSALGGAAHGVLVEYRTFPAHSLVRIPGHLSYEEASTLPCAAVTAYSALVGGYEQVKAGDTVLIQGTGGVSMYFAVASGATCIVLSSSDEKLKVATRLGAAHVINYRTTPEWADEARRLTHGRGVDRVVEVVGNATLARSFAAVRYGGSIDIIGLLSGMAPPVDIITHAIFKQLKIRGIYVGSVAQFKAMNRLLAAHAATRPIVDRVFPFEEAPAAFAYMARQEHVGKVVIRVAAAE